MTSLVFFGNTIFSRTILEWLSQESLIKIVGVVTRPDKPVGRKKIITPTPVKEYALKEKIQVHETEKLSTFLDAFQSLHPDLCVVAAYGKIIPKSFLALPKYGYINVHASLLPKYRGASPINWALINGDEKAGVTIMGVIEEMDAAQKELNSGKWLSTAALAKKLGVSL